MHVTCMYDVKCNFSCPRLIILLALTLMMTWGSSCPSLLSVTSKNVKKDFSVLVLLVLHWELVPPSLGSKQPVSLVAM